MRRPRHPEAPPLLRTVVQRRAIGRKPVATPVASPTTQRINGELEGRSSSQGGLPPRLRAGVERLSGIAMDDVRVHRNSLEPAKLGAHAFARSTEIHLAAGKEQHLPHEAWHVVQQKQGRVGATEQFRGQALNCDAGLEAEADRMGHMASEGRNPFGTNPRSSVHCKSDQALQLQPIKLELPSSKEDIRVRVQSGPGLPVALRNKLQDMLDRKITIYTHYREAIDKATPAERQFALERRPLLGLMLETLDTISATRLVERLGRRAPTFEELRSNKVVAEAIKDAWQASDIGKNDRVAQAHEEGGWVFMNIIDGSLSIRRAKPEGTNFIRLEPPPDVSVGDVLVATFHTHPTIGRRDTAFPSSHDKVHDKRRGVPNLVAGNVGTKSDAFQIRLSGPNQRKHLASEKKIPGPSGGIAP